MNESLKKMPLKKNKKVGGGICKKRKGKVHYGKMLIKQIKAEMWVPGTNSKRERGGKRGKERGGERGRRCTGGSDTLTFLSAKILRPRGSASLLPLPMYPQDVKPHP